MREPKQNNNKGEETTPEPSLFQIASYVARQLRAALEADLRPYVNYYASEILMRSKSLLASDYVNGGAQ